MVVTEKCEFLEKSFVGGKQSYVLFSGLAGLLKIPLHMADDERSFMQSSMEKDWKLLMPHVGVWT